MKVVRKRCNWTRTRCGIPVKRDIGCVGVGVIGGKLSVGAVGASQQRALNALVVDGASSEKYALVTGVNASKIKSDTSSALSFCIMGWFFLVKQFAQFFCDIDEFAVRNHGAR